jgi:hypothetical protein
MIRRTCRRMVGTLELDSLIRVSIHPRPSTHGRMWHSKHFPSFALKLEGCCWSPPLPCAYLRARPRIVAQCKGNETRPPKEVVSWRTSAPRTRLISVLRRPIQTGPGIYYPLCWLLLHLSVSGPRQIKRLRGPAAGTNYS